MKTRLVLGTVAAALAAVALAPTSASAAIIFATFSEPAIAQPFTLTNNSTGFTISASTPVDFEFTAASGLPTTVHNATLTISGPQMPTQAFTAGALFDQPIPLTSTLSITEVGSGANLLTMSFNGDITGFVGGPNGSLSGADTLGKLVTYTSDFLTFSGPGNSYNLGLANASVPFSIGPGGFLNSFVANIDGQFTAGNASGSNPPVPEPASLGILALGAAALITRRRKH